MSNSGREKVEKEADYGRESNRLLRGAADYCPDRKIAETETQAGPAKALKNRNLKQVEPRQTRSRFPASSLALCSLLLCKNPAPIESHARLLIEFPEVLNREGKTPQTV